MPARHRSREKALQILFLVDVRKQPPADAVRAFYDSLSSNSSEEDETATPDVFAEQLVHGTAAKSAEIDRQISQNSEHWRLDRMPAVDRNILRMAVYEMTDGGTPPAVVIDEALELARRFSGDESVSFINGVLDAIRKQVQPEAPPPPEP